MKQKFQFISTILPCGIRTCICGLLANAIFLHAQEFQTVVNGTPPGVPADATNHIFRTGGAVEAGLVINGFDLGAVLLKACDVDQDGKATLGEVKYVASAWFRTWDTNVDGYLSQGELSTALKALFPTPAPGAAFGFRSFSGTPPTGSTDLPVTVAGQSSLNVRDAAAAPSSSDEPPTPDSQLAKHIFAGADANKDGFLSLQELSDFLDKSFSQWDQNSDGSLDANEFALAFGQLALPDGGSTAVQSR